MKDYFENNKIMTTMDKVKYCLTLYQNNKETLTVSEIDMFGVWMNKAVRLYDLGFRRKDFQKMSILWDNRFIVRIN